MWRWRIVVTPHLGEIQPIAIGFTVPLGIVALICLSLGNIVFKKFTFLLVVMITASMSFFSFAQDQNQKIEEINLILSENPEIIEPLHQYLTQHANQAQSIARYEPLFHHSDQPFFGSEEPELTIVAFYDYSCPFCKRLEPELEKVVKAYPNVKVVHILMPLKERGQTENSAALAMNVWKNDRSKFAETHELLVSKRGAHNVRSVNSIAERTSTEPMLAQDFDTQQLLDANYQAFIDLGMRGTPAMLVGDEIVSGYVPFERLKSIVDQKL